MDPQAQASFIPKRTFDSSVASSGGGAFGGLLFVIALFLFIASIVAAGGAFAYQSYLTKSISDQSSSLQKAEALFDPGAIQELVRIDARINQATTLLGKHVAPSAVFSFLADQTLQNVQFTSLQYSLETDGSAKISLDGVADSFATVALQSDQLNANKSLKNVVFSGIKVDTGGKIGFAISATLDASVINFQKHLQSLQAGTAQTSPSAAAPVAQPQSASAPTPTNTGTPPSPFTQ